MPRTAPAVGARRSAEAQVPGAVTLAIAQAWRRVAEDLEQREGPMAGDAMPGAPRQLDASSVPALAATISRLRPGRAGVDRAERGTASVLHDAGRLRVARWTRRAGRASPPSRTAPRQASPSCRSRAGFISPACEADHPLGQTHVHKLVPGGVRTTIAIVVTTITVHGVRACN